MNSRICLMISGLCLTQVGLAQDHPQTTKPSEQPAKNAQHKPNAEELFEKGRQELFRGHYDQAIKLLKQAIAKESEGDGTLYRLHLARAYHYAGQSEESEKLLVAILKSSPDHAEAGQLLAEIYRAEKRWKEIKNLLEPLLKYRNDYPTYNMLAEATYELGKFEAARKYYRQAIRLNPNSPDDHYQLGNIYLSENLFALAAQSYESALRLGLQSPVLHYKLASAYFNLRNYFGKVAVVDVPAGQPGTVTEDWYLIEPIARQKNQFRAAPKRSAVFHIAHAMKNGLGQRADLKLLLANTYLNARRYRQAFELFSKLEGEVPQQDQPLYHYSFAQAAFGIRKYEDYLSHLKEAIQLDPEAYESALVDAYLRVADRYNQAGQLDRYIDYLKLAVDQSPQTASLHLKLASGLEEARKFDQAIIQWRMVLDLEPEHPDRTRLLNLIQRYRSQPLATKKETP